MIHDILNSGPHPVTSWQVIVWAICFAAFVVGGFVVMYRAANEAADEATDEDE